MSPLPQRQLSSFFSSLQQHCNLLEELSLSLFYESYPLDSSDSKIWVSFFQNTPKSLKTLSLTLNLSMHQQSEGIQAFIESLEHIKHLTSLSLSSSKPFSYEPLEFLDDFFLSVFTSLQSLTQLEELELDFSEFFCIDEIYLQQFCSLLQCLKNLKKLDINFPYLPSPDQDLISIAESLRPLNHLKTLDLTLHNNFSHECMRALSYNIADLHLVNLNLDVGCFYGPSTPVSSSESDNLILFCCNLHNLTSLSTLKLQLSHFEISNKEFKYLSLALQNLKSLSSLNLTLCQFSSAKNSKGFQRLFYGLKDLPKLSYLDLTFKGERILDQEIEILSSSLAGCKSLETFDLQFLKAAQFKDKNLYSLLLGIRGLLGLKSLVLLFKKKEAFGKKALSDFVKGLTALKDLEKFCVIQKPIYQSNKTLLPPNLQGYEKLRHLKEFVVMNSRFI